MFFKGNMFNLVDFLYLYYKKFVKIETFVHLSKRSKLYEKSKIIFDKNFEVNNIIKKNIEIELIKYLLFSSDQLNLYKLVKKPLISLMNINLSDFEKVCEEFNEDKLYSTAELKSLVRNKKQDINNSFVRIYEKKQSNIINKKLLKMVEERIESMLDD